MANRIDLNALLLDGEREAASKTLSSFDRDLAMLDYLIAHAEASSDVDEAKARAAIALGVKL